MIDYTKAAEAAQVLETRMNRFMGLLNRWVASDREMATAIATWLAPEGHVELHKVLVGRAGMMEEFAEALGDLGESVTVLCNEISKASNPDG